VIISTEFVYELKIYVKLNDRLQIILQLDFKGNHTCPIARKNIINFVGSDINGIYLNIPETIHFIVCK